MTPAYTQLHHTFTRLSRFDHLSAIAGWDSAAMMSPQSSQARSEAMAELDLLRHQILTDARVGEWFKDVGHENLNELERANLHEMHRTWHNTVVLPDWLVEARTLAGARCEHAWRTQRPANDWNGFADNLREVVKLARQEAQIRAEAAGTSRYDAMLDLYEPGLRAADLDRIFGDLKTWLPGLLQQVVAKQAQSTPVPLQGPFATERQRALGLQVMQLLGFNFEQGRVDVSTHPFCGGVPQDVRITTRYKDDDFLPALLGIIHETGHARYEQNRPGEWLSQPMGRARSMGVHESQSLLFEMQLARSPAFLRVLHPWVIEQFGQQPALQLDNFIALNQRVKPGHIRVDADEVSYPLHVILRYEIERALIEGEIEVDDIPTLWADKMQQYLGIDTRGDYRNGCMQDIHWTDGSFGYFPTYTLGAMYAAQLFQAARNAVPGLDDAIAAGNLQSLSGWLKENVWQHGSRFSTADLITRATGETLNPAFFRKHLEARYL
ncbi:carboxypeptidase M32 [Amantichitinum ursilacus]|uniref:Metal-dependent carboxypeptidase n=1 Tax=Amantichitinum ursilacus TaxID=857265 RepID=A0A0N0XFX7_9NEIS|nr:carboxypeptidase M32 [Amantichitinum ursilacus]KPC49533.1 Thermostable carboxypeptidase 1 [Amantichitinum ursilacus]